MKTQISLLAAALPSLVSAYPSRSCSPHGIITTADNVVNKTFDYIITGGGLTGLTVASRLSEDSNISVLVIEAGRDDHEDPRVYDVRTYGEAFESDIDYNITSTPISWRNNKTLPMAAGKTLGGSSAINGASWTKGPKTQYDLLPHLIGDDTWGFGSFNRYMLQNEHFNPPSAELVAKGAKYDPNVHGYNGTLQVSFAQGFFGHIQQPALHASESVWKGLKILADVASGIVNGATTIPNMLQSDASQNRSWSYTAFLEGEPETRENLVVLTGHRVVRIIWKDSTNDTLIAEGVEFQASRDSPILVARASREILLASGSMQSPQLLELSGVGDAGVLSAAGVPLTKELSGVGKNLQEQTKNSVYYVPESVDFNGTGPSTAIAFPNVYQLLRDNASTIYAETIAGLSTYAAELEKQGMVASANATENILRLQLNNLFNDSEAAAEVFFTINTSTGLVGADIWNLIVLARGTIHISSNSSWDLPTVHPAYFEHPLDLVLQTSAVMQAREVFNTAPLSDYISSEDTPGYVVVAKDADYKTWEEWVKQNFTSVWHPIATLSCMKRELGGVVDSRLKVYGIENVRAIDASVLPVQLSAHLSSSLYGIAEKAAEMIKADQ
ncbi:hypothetical protein BDV97DRAFT_372446 [Delphinella strobiligena]|nr:hypothetical protein BDV97DRAFT_372446 [Delphinella strobiligena]